MNMNLDNYYVTDGITSGLARIYAECTGQSDTCLDSVSIIPKPNTLESLHSTEFIDSFPDWKAEEIFLSRGWKIFGVNGSFKTRCPECK